ncbi:MAG: hypothetical protein CL681_01860 [Blastopirellula sp.]|nr:hypothetical protein [Blastopirellula sp.]|tara:strand:- start:191 stop:472 length:282 start_codon:yes stop_codon:yes gene_type:complete
MAKSTNLFGEKCIPITQVPAYLDKHIGYRPCVVTVYRWVRKGRHGRCLESMHVGGTHFTSQEALLRFFGVEETPPPTKRKASKVERELEREGI